MGRNKPLRAWLTLTLLGTALLASGLVPGHGRSVYAIAAPHAPDELVVQLVRDDLTTIEAINADYGTTTVRQLKATLGTYLLKTPAGADVATTLQLMRADQRLHFAEPNYLGQAPEARPRKIRVWGGPSDAPRNDQYAVEATDLNDAHDYATGEGITVAVIDTGIQMDHPALAANLLTTGYDFVDEDDDPSDVGDGVDDDLDGVIDEALGHGTHIAGIVLLAAPAAQILPIRALTAEGIGDVYALALAIEYAVEQGADVINLSLSTDLETDLLRDVVRAATSQGVLVVAAAGNSDSAAPEYPAADECTVGVTAVDQERRLAPDATRGSWVDLAAPGESIYSALPVSGYGWWSGTSMAAPFVSGQAAVLLAARPDLNLRQLTSLMNITGRGISDADGDAAHVRTINIGSSARLAVLNLHLTGRMSFLPSACLNAEASPESDMTAEPPVTSDQ